MEPADCVVGNSKVDLKDLYAKFDQVLNDVIRIPGKPAWIVLCGYAIGETAQFCSLADEFVKTHGHGIILVVTPRQAPIAQMYAHRFLKIVSINYEWMNLMLRSGYIPQDRFEIDLPLSGCWIDLGFRHSNGIKYLMRYPGRGGVSLTDMFRFVLRLPWNSRLEPPKILPEWEEDAWQLAKKVGLRVGRSVLLCPINNSGKKMPDVFWETTAARLIENGYKVFTNMGGINSFNSPPTMPVKGTVPVDLPVHLAMIFMNLAGRVISGGNGMLYFTMIAGFESFKVTHLVGISSKEDAENHSSLGYTQGYNATRQELLVGSALQYASPELCLRTLFDEYMLPYDEESPEELRRLAVVVVDQNTNDPSCIKRYESNGKLFIEEHIDWLKELV